MTMPRLPAAALLALLALTGGRHPVRAAAPAETPSALLRFSLRDTGGAAHTNASWAGARAIVLFFIMPDCPISQSYVPEMNRLAQAYAARGIKVFAVQSDIAATVTDVERHVHEFAYAFPVLLDPQQTLVRHTGATTTPEAAVVTPDGEVLYRGRIDNRVVGLGTRRVKATSFEVRDALDAVIAGRPVAVTRTTAIGCIITRRAS